MYILFCRSIKSQWYNEDIIISSSHCPLHRTAVTYFIFSSSFFIHWMAHWVFRHCFGMLSWPVVDFRIVHAAHTFCQVDFSSIHKNQHPVTINCETSKKKKRQILHAKYFRFYNNNRTENRWQRNQRTKNMYYTINRLCRLLCLYFSYISLFDLLWLVWNDETGFYFYIEISSNPFFAIIQARKNNTPNYRFLQRNKLIQHLHCCTTTTKNSRFRSSFQIGT